MGMLYAQSAQQEQPRPNVPLSLAHPMPFSVSMFHGPVRSPEPPAGLPARGATTNAAREAHVIGELQKINEEQKRTIRSARSNKRRAIVLAHPLPRQVEPASDNASDATNEVRHSLLQAANGEELQPIERSSQRSHEALVDAAPLVLPSHVVPNDARGSIWRCETKITCVCPQLMSESRLPLRCS